MNPVALDSIKPAPKTRAPQQAFPPSPQSPPTPRWQRFPAVPLGLTACFLAFVFFPPVRDNPRLVTSFVGIGAALLAWELMLWASGRRRGRVFRIDYVPVKSHWVQACVQSCIMLYWGWFWPPVYPELTLILAQVVFLYALDALLSWTRGRDWRLGYGPLPIVISTNLLLWFRHDHYVFQFLMLATGALAKQFITWNREGKRTHIFNPSAFGQFLFALALIATGTTNDYTVGRDIAASFDTPYMLVVIFLGGLVVQVLFRVTLMTVAATATLVVVSLVYTGLTGVYFFVTINIAAPIFLGLHLLVTDPATSPRSNLGRVVFGVLYGLGYTVLFRALDLYDVPVFWDKLLPVPILNLCVPLIDRAVRRGIPGRLNGFWESSLRPARLNLVHMGVWASLFATLWATGFILAPHPGASIPFWKQALADDKPHAGNSLIMAAGALAEGGGSGAAFNELGLISMEGRLARENHSLAAVHFARACELGNRNGCANVVMQFLFLRERRSEADVNLALDRLERDCNREPSRETCYLVASAYETGHGRPRDPARAIDLYERSGLDNPYAVKGLARIGLSGTSPPYDLASLAPALSSACAGGDAENCWYLAYMSRAGNGVERNERAARKLLQQACLLGAENACKAAKMAELPPYSKPMMVVPGWSSAYPPSSGEPGEIGRG